MIPQLQWRWFGSAGHFICSSQCRFHMATKVGKFFVSTVGELYRDPHSDSPEDIGYGRKYETMVFHSGPACTSKCCGGCGMPTPDDWHEVDADGYNDAASATRGHYAMCFKYARKEAPMTVKRHGKPSKPKPNKPPR